MRRLAVLIAVGALWLFLAVLPALADGGPHVQADNSGVSTLTADGCAGCHRAHTAQGPMLLANEEQELCLNCHGSGGVGATTDVEAGVQYEIALPAGSAAQDPDTDPILGALRGGGLVEARIGSSEPARLAYLRNATDVSVRTKVSVLGTGQSVTSVHLNVTDPTTANAWGNGPVSATADVGTVMALECTSCHNPHGNGQYRILRPVPRSSGAADGSAVTISATTASNDRITTATPHGFVIGGLVNIVGRTDITDGVYSVTGVPAVNTFTLAGVNIGANGGAGGTATADADVNVDDAKDVDTSRTRNYTVIQTRGTQGDNSTYLLYASDVVAAGYGPTAGDYFHRTVPWNPGGACDPTVDNSAQPACATANDAPNGRPASWTATNGLAADQVAFNDQITAWCTQCHTRYWANRNPNPGGKNGPPPTSAVNPLDAQSWWFPRPGEAVFKYQHQTTTNRACTTCHVSHGSNALMDGPKSSALLFPGQTAAPPYTTVAGVADSRLLKVNNRGTCQACHDPTETVKEGTYLSYVGGLVVEDKTVPYENMKPVP